MKIKAVVEKRTFGIMEIEIPDDMMENTSSMAIKRRINKMVETQLLQNPDITWDEEETITYGGNYIKKPTQEREEQERDE